MGGRQGAAQLLDNYPEANLFDNAWSCSPPRNGTEETDQDERSQIG
jgi:hypothetical protein